MPTLDSAQKSAQIEVEIDKKAQRDGEKMLRYQWDQNDICNNFATPLPGTFLNLPRVSCLLQCPSCGVKDMTKIELECHRSDWAAIFFYCCLCRCCPKEKFFRHFVQKVPNHYCKHCSCYFGQHCRFDKIKV